MRLTTTFLFIFLAFNSYSQNVEKEIKETISWLNDKVQIFQINGKIKAEYELNFEKLDNDFYIKIHQDFYTFGKDKGITEKSLAYIPIKEIGNIEFKNRGYKWQTEEERGYILFIYIKNDNHKILKETTTYFMGKESKSSKKENYYVINLKRTIDNENLRERIKKSFDYLKEITTEKKTEKF